MSLLDSFKSFIDQSKAGLLSEIAKYKSADFLDAMIGACAWEAYADGKVDSSEKTKMLGFIQRSEELKVFSTSDVLASWKRFDEAFTFDVNAGISEVCNALEKIKEVPQKRTIVLGCCAVSLADGTFDDNEKEVARKICGVLQLNPAEFNL